MEKRRIELRIRGGRALVLNVRKKGGPGPPKERARAGGPAILGRGTGGRGPRGLQEEKK